MTFRRYYGSSRSKEDLRNISIDQLGHIYKDGYWDKCRCDDLPAGVDYAVFDAAVNSGPARSAKWLQGAVGAERDGGIGPQTLAKVADHRPEVVVTRMLDARLAFLKSLATWPYFGRGWGRRVEEVRTIAGGMAGSASEGNAPVPVEEPKVVRKGDSGKWVEKLQEALGLKTDGEFGSRTEAAVMAFQEEQGLTVDGIAGRHTYRALGLIE
jgi:lysozyme family protein